MPAPVLTVTLNPALDVYTSVEHLEPQRKLRCSPPVYYPGGGGINVSRAILELGGSTRAYVGLGGSTGEQLRALLDRAGIDTRLRMLRGETRRSLHVLEKDSGAQYRFVMPGPEQDADAVPALLEDLVDSVRESGARYVVVSGSLPPGLPDDFHARLSERLSDDDTKLILDTSGAPLEHALGAAPFLIKPDRHEAQALLHGDEPEGASWLDRADRLRERTSAEVVIVTCGAEGACIAGPELRAHIRPPEVEVRSTVGAGDTFVGALAYALAADWPLDKACRYAVGAAAAAVMTEGTRLARKQDVDRLFERTTLTER